jgi:hypothetical protein
VALQARQREVAGTIRRPMRGIRVREIRKEAMIEWNKLPDHYKRVLNFKNIFKQMKKKHNTTQEKKCLVKRAEKKTKK